MVFTTIEPRSYTKAKNVGISKAAETSDGGAGTDEFVIEVCPF